ncbi:unnamed protein product [Cyprideis torosa]|uniref:Uncharacterized protein n=1 Tax=Cyprideis torosa TaxID=163714 RepID=A0A7R8ZN98_9CRUS|nr:unnamed protein product [Cyprideis torosa]CAG0891057.1 unnamed protein product [Cyprideis torosa]
MALSVSQGLEVCYSVLTCIVVATNIQYQMTSVERVLEFSRLRPEAPWESSLDKKPLPSWPDTGSITFRDVGLCYQSATTESPGYPALKHLNFHIQGGEKVGVVGRTGAGKSSLVSGLFRLVEPSGTVMIDGIDIKSIGLHDLRKNLTIVPQDPALFAGTIRKNLDPFDDYADESLWEVLEKVELGNTVRKLPDGLETSVLDDGTGFSMGECQLFCLGRALLRRTRILILDEATANVDLKTDQLIQKTLRKSFQEHTVITIAHRLETVIDNDRILVLENGSVQEFGRPSELLRNKSGAFMKLVENADFDIKMTFFDETGN